MEKKVSLFLQKNNIKIENKIICAVSGGVDSVCLINILHNLGYKVILAHVNHHKRAQSEIEQKAMLELANKLNCPFELLNYYYDGEDNFHNDSHFARYNFFKALCSKYNTNVIATAHHLDDQIETILIKLMEGSNLFGYGGISVLNDDGEYKIIRPLLCCSKEELYTLAKERNYVYFEDSSNHEDEFLRNRLRHHVIPLLKQECPDIYEKVSNYSQQVKEAFSYIRSISIDYLAKTNNIIRVDSFSTLNIAIKKDIISLLLERYNINKNVRIIEDILDMLKSTEGSKKMTLSNNNVLIRSYNEAYITNVNQDSIEEIELDLFKKEIYNGRYAFYFSKNMPKNNAKYIKLCYNDLRLPLIVRTKRDGDVIKSLVGSKRVSRVLIDNKIPKDLRNQVPIITDNMGNILWVYDLIKSKDVYEQKKNGEIFLIVEDVNYA